LHAEASTVSIRIQIDKAGSNNESTRVDRVPAIERISADAANPALSNSYVADRVDSRLRIDDAATADNEVIPIFRAFTVLGATNLRDSYRGDEERDTRGQ
jgi:hypothetical protein